MSAAANMKRAKADRQCGGCDAVIPKGSVYFTFRERALSSYEACHAGRYPERKRCPSCWAKRGGAAQLP